MLEPFRLDEASILERLGGEEDILAMMIDMYVSDAENYCTALLNAAAGGQAGTLQREAHTIKGLLASFSDDAGTQVAFQIESEARHGRVEGLEAPVAEVVARLREIADVLRQRGA